MSRRPSGGRRLTSVATHMTERSRTTPKPHVATEKKVGSARRRRKNGDGRERRRSGSWSTPRGRYAETNQLEGCRGMPARLLVAPDSFKGKFRATEVAAAVGRGIE